MSRCPGCHEDLEDGASACPRCGTSLAGDTPSASTPVAGDSATPGRFDVRLGTFHPAVADRIAELLYRRAITHHVLVGDDVAEIRIDPAWRDDVRTELTLTWPDLLAGLEDTTADEVRATGGWAPGWLDAPQGGHVDRSGRLVVDAADDDDAARVVGPALLAFGAMVAIVGWYAVDSAGIATVGAAMALVGLLLPR